jgi:hypothetical protein
MLKIELERYSSVLEKCLKGSAEGEWRLKSPRMRVGKVERTNISWMRSKALFQVML